MPELLALSAAVVFGLVHFFSGLLARRADSYGVAVVGQVGGTILVPDHLIVSAACARGRPSRLNCWSEPAPHPARRHGRVGEARCSTRTIGAA
jgi:hypothetical protein